MSSAFVPMPAHALAFFGGDADQEVRARRNVVEPLAQRRDHDRKYVQAVEQVFAEASAFTSAIRSRLVAETMRTSTLTAPAAPTGFDFAFLQRAQQFDPAPRRQFADLVEDSVPPSPR